MKAKKTNVVITSLTVISAIGAGLGTLPIPSKDLPLFDVWPESRAWVMSAGFLGLALRMVAVAIRDALAPTDKSE